MSLKKRGVGRPRKEDGVDPLTNPLVAVSVDYFTDESIANLIFDLLSNKVIRKQDLLPIIEKGIKKLAKQR